MRWLQPELQYRRNGPFYGIVLAYLCQVHGFIELASRGLALRFAHRTPEDREAFAQSLDGRNVQAAQRVFSGGITELLSETQLASLVSDPIKVNVSELAAVVFIDNEAAIQHFNLQSAGSLVVLAWELSDPFHTHDPAWEFLRHVRNAAAHGGRFHLLGNEPTRPASWRGRNITRTLEGTPLFNAPVATAFLGIGDVLHLLADIDRDLLGPANP